MKLLVQWSLVSPGDWIEVDLRSTGPTARAWERIAAKPEPQGGEQIDHQPGWVYDLNVQGIQFGGYDHYSVRPLAGDGLEVTVWNDDPEDGPPETFEASVWTLMPPVPDPRHSGAMNTVQSCVRYVGAAVPVPDPPPETSTGPVVYRPWSEFVPPPAALTRHGVWLSQAQDAAHRTARGIRGWQEWAA